MNGESVIPTGRTDSLDDSEEITLFADNECQREKSSDRGIWRNDPGRTFRSGGAESHFEILPALAERELTPESTGTVPTKLSALRTGPLVRMTPVANRFIGNELLATLTGKLSSLRLAILCLIFLNILLSISAGQNVDYFRTATAGAFRTAAQWSPFDPVPPGVFLGPGGATDRAHFNLGQSFFSLYTLTDVAGFNQRLLIQNDSVRLIVADYETLGNGTGTNASIVVGNAAGDVGTAVFSGGVGSQLNSVFTSVASTFGSTGTIIVNGDGFNWDNSSTLDIGRNGNGNLSILDGTVTSNLIYIGRNAGSNGMAAVNGSSSSLLVDTDLVVGHSATGTLSVENGGAVLSAVGRIGSFVGGSGEAVVEGGGSSWTAMDELSIGEGGEGSLLVMDNAEVDSLVVMVGDDSSAEGNLFLSGNGTLSTSFLFVGLDGTGIGTATDGSHIASGIADIGRQPGSFGTVQINSSATWATNLLTIGREGTGTLSVRSAGQLDCNFDAFVGQLPGSSGAVTVRDPLSRWSVDRDLVIGGNFTPAAQNGGQGDVTVRNDGRINVEGDIFLFPDGNLNLLSGGTLSADSIELIGAGNFNFTGGILHVDSFSGDLENDGGTLAPGNVPFVTSPIGGTTVLGDYSQNQFSTLEFQLQGPGAGTGFDLVTVTGDAFLDGNLRLQLLNGFVPSPAASFSVMNVTPGTMLFGFFDNVGDGDRLGTVDGGGSFLVRYGVTSPNPNQIILSDFQSSFILGDVNGDGVVDLLDVAPFVAVVTSGIYNPAADIDMDGDVDLLDVAPFVALLTS